jgi:hypothetical protein
MSNEFDQAQRSQELSTFFSSAYFHIQACNTGNSSEAISSREVEAKIAPPSPPGVADTEDLSLANFGNLDHFLRRELNKLSIGLNTARRYALRQHYGEQCRPNQMMRSEESNVPVLLGWHA